jgi:hypothetical protein
MLRYDATAGLKAINLPALVVAGDKDSVCKPEASDRMHREVPKNFWHKDLYGGFNWNIAAAVLPSIAFVKIGQIFSVRLVFLPLRDIDPPVT